MKASHAALAALGLLLMLSTAQAIHVCNSGWKDYWEVEDDSFGLARADRMFERVMRKTARREGCAVLSLRKLEGCRDPASKWGKKAEPRSWGFGAEALLKCKGRKARRHLVVGATERKNGGIKLDYVYNNKWRT